MRGKKGEGVDVLREGEIGRAGAELRVRSSVQVAESAILLGCRERLRIRLGLEVRLRDMNQCPVVQCLVNDSIAESPACGVLQAHYVGCVMR